MYFPDTSDASRSVEKLRWSRRHELGKERTLNDPRKKAAILVSSFDGCADLWDPFFTLFFRYWPDCPYDIYLIGQNKVYEDDRVHMLHTKPGTDWSSTLQEALQKLSAYDYLLIFLEDYLLQGPTDTARVIEYELAARSSEAITLRLFPIPAPDRRFQNCDDLGEILPGAAYRTSLLPAWWRRESMMELLVTGETPWQFELDGTVRSDALEGLFLSVQHAPPIDCYLTGVLRGKWVQGAVALCEREGIKIDLSARSIEGTWERRIRMLRIKTLDFLAERLGRTRRAKSPD